jgi:hypothetical protein
MTNQQRKNRLPSGRRSIRPVVGRLPMERLTELLFLKKAAKIS